MFQFLPFAARFRAFARRGKQDRDGSQVAEIYRIPEVDDGVRAGLAKKNRFRAKPVAEAGARLGPRLKQRGEVPAFSIRSNRSGFAARASAPSRVDFSFWRRGAPAFLPGDTRQCFLCGLREIQIARHTARPGVSAGHAKDGFDPVRTMDGARTDPGASCTE